MTWKKFSAEDAPIGIICVRRRINSGDEYYIGSYHPIRKNIIMDAVITKGVDGLSASLEINYETDEWQEVEE